VIKNRFWRPSIEKLSAKQLGELQNRRLKSIVSCAYEKSPFYRRVFKERKIRPISIRTIDDLQRLPFTSKTDFRDNYPLGLLAAPLSEVVRLHVSSGTTGDPTVVAYTRRDLDSWSDCIARCLTMTGITRNDVFQVILGYGLFTGGLGFHYGAEKIGAAVVPASAGNTQRQIKLMHDLQVTAFTSIPSYTLFLAETARGLGIDPARDLKIRSISCGAEVWTESTRERIEKEFGCQVFNSYGLSEMCGPGVAFECVRQDGMHIWGDHFLVEIVDPRTGDPLGAEQVGELVLTTLTKEAVPLLRYRTRDLAMLFDGACDCGRTHQRIGWITGRCDDMMKIRGVNVFPSQIESAIMGLDGVGNNYQISLSRKGPLDEMAVTMEVEEDVWNRGDAALKDLTEKLRSRIEHVIGLKVDVVLLAPLSLPRVEGKVRRVIDSRGLMS
jgi:phenylacetate-CoA ligase